LRVGNSEEVAKRLELIPDVKVLTAQFVSANADGTVLVDFGAGAVQIYSAGFYTPLPGAFVRTLRVNGLTLMLGPVQPRSAYGRVTATGTPKLTLLLPDGSTVQLPYVVSAYTAPALDDDVLISWADGGVIVGKVTEVPLSNYLPAPSGGGGSAGGSFSTEFVADASGSFQSGQWWRDDVWCSDGNIGAWFYGTAVADTIPDGAVIGSVALLVNETYNEYPGSLATIGTHGLTSRSGTPAIAGAHGIAAGSGWRALPVAYGNALKTGAAFGLGTNHGGYHKFSARTADANSGRLRIEWSI
jgi:hypothetical protein